MATIFFASGMRTEVGKRRREKGRDVPAAVDMQREVKVQDNELFAEVVTKKRLSGFAKFDKTYPKSSPGAAWYDVLQSKTGIGQFHPDDSANPGHVHIHVERLHGWKTVRVWLISGCGEVLAVSPSSRRQEVKRRYEIKKMSCVCEGGFPTSQFGDNMLMISSVELKAVNRYGGFLSSCLCKGNDRLWMRKNTSKS